MGKDGVREFLIESPLVLSVKIFRDASVPTYCKLFGNGLSLRAQMDRPAMPRNLSFVETAVVGDTREDNFGSTSSI